MSLSRTLCGRLNRLLRRSVSVTESTSVPSSPQRTILLSPKKQTGHGVGLGFRPWDEAPRLHYSTAQQLPNNKVLQEWCRDVSPFGSVTIRLSIPARVIPVQALDKTRVQLISSDEGSEWEKMVKVEVEVGGEGVMVSSTTTGVLPGVSPLLCIIEVPCKYGVAATLRGNAGIEVEGLEGESFSLVTEDGSISAKNLKCGNLRVATRGGDIVCAGAIIGNVDIKAGGSGKVCCDRVQGTEIVLANETGPIDIKALYADRASFSSLGGPVTIGMMHCASTITLKEGQLDIGCLEGSLKAFLGKGDINVQIVRLDNFQIKTESGDVNIKVPPDFTSTLKLKGRYIQFDKVAAVGMEQKQGEWKLYQGALGEGKDSHVIEATARGGRIKLTEQDWISGLKTNQT